MEFIPVIFHDVPSYCTKCCMLGHECNSSGRNRNIMATGKIPGCGNGPKRGCSSSMTANGGQGPRDSTWRTPNKYSIDVQCDKPSLFTRCSWLRANKDVNQHSPIHLASGPQMEDNIPEGPSHTKRVMEKLSPSMNVCTGSKDDLCLNLNNLDSEGFVQEWFCLREANLETMKEACMQSENDGQEVMDTSILGPLEVMTPKANSSSMILSRTGKVKTPSLKLLVQTRGMKAALDPQQKGGQ
ncbi:unnamed protein product [Cuscuta campestris]|uniref:Uncharacterized protein n=1 Tax=Cuscuta campestris TaxID=132261 RepID=A0A484MY29_9ASTE|nr:unnamed protein product [Cuscuta campestris]